MGKLQPAFGIMKTDDCICPFSNHFLHSQYGDGPTLVNDHLYL